MSIPIKFLLLSIFLSASVAAKNEQVIPLLEEQVCQGRSIEVLKMVDQVRDQNDVGLKARLISLETDAGLSREVDIAKKMDRSASNADRIVAAFSLLQSADYRPEMIRELVSFDGSKALENSYKNVILANLTHDRREALRSLIDAYRESPSKDVGILSQIFFIAFEFKDYEKILGQFVPDIREIPDDSPSKYLMLYHLEFLPPNRGDKLTANNFLQKAFEKCPYNESIALTYAFSLKEIHHYTELETLLRGEVKKRALRSPYIDFLLGEVLFERGFKEEAKVYFKNAKAKKNLLDPADIERLDTEYSAATSGKKALLFIGVLLLVFILGSGFFIRKRK